MYEQTDGTYDNPFKFNMKKLDDYTGLYYYGARYYNPRLSIWYRVDPLAVYNPVMESEFYGDGQHNGGVFYWGNLNPYIYTYQNPINFIDPNGKQVDLRKYGGGSVNFYRQKPYSNGKPGKYEYIRIEGDSSKPTTNVYQQMTNKTAQGYGSTTFAQENQLFDKEANIEFKSSSTQFEDGLLAERGFDNVSNAMVSVDQDLEVYGSSTNKFDDIVKDLDKEGDASIIVQDLANNRSNKIKSELIKRGVSSLNIKKGENKYQQSSTNTKLRYKIPKKQILTSDQLLNKIPIIGKDIGK